MFRRWWFLPFLPFVIIIADYRDGDNQNPKEKSILLILVQKRASRSFHFVVCEVACRDINKFRWRSIQAEPRSPKLTEVAQSWKLSCSVGQVRSCTMHYGT